MTLAIDVCRLCDRPITDAQLMHRFLGKGWCHGRGARESLPVHWHCCVVDQGDGEHGYSKDTVMGRSVMAYLRREVAKAA
jgi:hypothetical protein